MISTEAPAGRAPMPILTRGGTLGILGAGVMGRALAKGLLSAGVVDPSSIWAAARSEKTCDEAAQQLGVAAVTRYRDRVPKAEVLILCVKPAQLEKVVVELRSAGLSEDTLLISILAGATTARIQSLLESNNPVIRAMPNTPCIVNEGMTVVCPGTYATAEHMNLAERVFSAVGKCIPVDEVYCDAITALSGSGPAYVYLIIEALADAGVRVGLPRGLALKLVTQTVLGATKVVQETGRHPAGLRDDVTTPAGCTIGGVLMLEDGKIRSVLARAVEEATRIASELGKPKQK